MRPLRKEERLTPEKLRELARSRPTGPMGDAGAIMVVQITKLLQHLRQYDEEEFRARFQRDALEAMNGGDVPRLARIALSFFDRIESRAVRDYVANSRARSRQSKAKVSQERLEEAWNRPKFAELSSSERARQLARDGYGPTASSIERRIQRIHSRGQKLRH